MNIPIIPVEVIALLEEPNLQTPVVVLHSRQPNKVLPIWIGHPEARAMAVILQNVKTERPLTHDLILSTFIAFNAKMTKVVIDRLEGHTYYAKISLIKQNEKIDIDARPSDAIALALKSHIPIFVAEEIMEKAGQDNPFEKTPPQKKEFTEEEMKKLEQLLKAAQQREQGEV